MIIACANTRGRVGKPYNRPLPPPLRNGLYIYIRTLHLTDARILVRNVLLRDIWSSSRSKD